MESLPLFCSDHSLQVNEALYGTVSQARWLFLLEYDQPWGKKAFAESSIPPAVKEYINTILESTPLSKLLLIRQQPRLVTGGLRFFLADTSPAAPRLVEFSFAGYEEILSLNIEALLDESTRDFQPGLRTEPLFLTCTNARRDSCCARLGLPVYQTLSSKYGSLVWQTSHVGGHRFAANLIFLPFGVFLGRVSAPIAPYLAEQLLAGQINLDHYRGKVFLPQVIQAAEVFLRRHTALTGITDVYLSGLRQEADFYFIQFFTATNKSYRLDLKVSPAKYLVKTSCSDEKASPVAGFDLLELHEIA